MGIRDLACFQFSPSDECGPNSSTILTAPPSIDNGSCAFILLCSFTPPPQLQYEGHGECDLVVCCFRSQHLFPNPDAPRKP